MSRTYALQILYSLEVMASFNQGSLEVEIAKNLSNFEIPLDNIEFTTNLILQTQNNIVELDKEIESKSSNWKVARMGLIDRNILRMALMEMKTGTATAVVINEAIELAKEFGDGDSPSFVNGILDSLKLS